MHIPVGFLSFYRKCKPKGAEFPGKSMILYRPPHLPEDLRF